MAESRIGTFGALLKPKVVRVGLALFGVLAAYDTLSSQLELPTVRRWWGMSGNLLPWWGWLLILQAIFVYALFEYVRRAQSPGAYDDTPLRDKIEALTLAADDTVAPLKENIETMGRKVDQLETLLGKVTALTTDLTDAQNKRFDAIDARQKLIIDDYQRMLAGTANLEEGLGEFGKKLAGVEARFGPIHAAFIAIFYREKMLSLAARIDSRATWLFEAVEGGGGKTLTYEEWQRWQAEEMGWRADLFEWTHCAGFYVPGAKEEIEAPDKPIYETAQWQFREEQFPTHESVPLLRSNAVHQYKTYRIAAGRWGVVRDKVHDVVRKVAFEGYAPPHWVVPPPQLPALL